jgi:hypothetical protein
MIRKNGRPFFEKIQSMIENVVRTNHARETSKRARPARVGKISSQSMLFQAKCRPRIGHLNKATAQNHKILLASEGSRPTNFVALE